jgi:DNA-binding NarL/FixJ family response regulator
VVALEGALADAVGRQLAAGEDAKTERLPTSNGRGAVYVSAVVLSGSHARHVAVWLREELLRDDRLFERLASRFGVTHRGFQLAQLVARGLSNREIAEQLKLSEATVKAYLHQLYRDCSVSSRTALVALLEEIRR